MLPGGRGTGPGEESAVANNPRRGSVGTMVLHESHPGEGHEHRSGNGAAIVSFSHGQGPTDEELIGRVRLRDDSAAFETLVHRYEHELFSYLRRYLGSAEMAEDVFQATFLQVHLKREN